MTEHDETEDLTTAYMLGRYDGRKDAKRQAQALSDPSGSAERAADNCRKGEVTKVKAAIHHGCIRFLMAVEGNPQNIGGIVYSFDAEFPLSEMRRIADEVNQILSPNTKD